MTGAIVLVVTRRFIGRSVRVIVDSNGHKHLSTGAVENKLSLQERGHGIVSVGVQGT